MEGQNYNSYYEPAYSQYNNYYEYPQVFYSPNYQTTYNNNNSYMVSNYYSSNFYSSETENNYSPGSHYNYYNNSFNTNDSGYISTSAQNSPCSIRTKLEYQFDDKSIQTQCSKKRKIDNTILEDNSDIIERKKSNAKRPKVVKLQNLESKDVEYKCEICLSVFNSAAKFLMHQFVHHKSGNSKQCPVCLRKFGSYSNAMVHLRGHTQEKLYQCKQCEKSFVDISTLKKHQRIHSGEKPFECHICFKKFSQSGNLTRHLTTHTDEMSAHYPVSEKQTSDSVYSQKMTNTFMTQETNNLQKENSESFNNANFYQYQIPQGYEFNYYFNY